MSVDDFATTLAYLMCMCWSAAARQLHLASIGDSEPSSPAQSFRAKPTPSSTNPPSCRPGYAHSRREALSQPRYMYFVPCTCIYGSVVL